MLIISAGEDQEKASEVKERMLKHQGWLRVKDAWADPNSLYMRVYSIEDPALGIHG